MNTRNRQFFHQLSGLARGLDAAIERNKPAKPHDTNKLHRSDADVQSRLDKQSAKLARRAVAHQRSLK